MGRHWFHRRLRRPELLRRVSIFVIAVLLVPNVACFVLDAPHFWRTSNLTVTLGGLGVLAVAIIAMRTGTVRAGRPGGYWRSARILTILSWMRRTWKFVDSGHEVQGWS